jgi:hypothetical protein
MLNGKATEPPTQPPAAKVSMMATDKTKPGQSKSTNVSKSWVGTVICG